MMKNNDCKIVSDLLPLYIDGVVSDETKKFVEKHLNECEDCKKEYKKMSEKLVVPTNEEVNKKDAEIIKGIKKKFKNKKFRGALFSTLITLVVLVSIFLYVSLHQIPISYSENQMNIVEESGKLYLYYNGNYYGSKQFSYEQKDTEKATNIVYLYNTPINKFRKNLDKSKSQSVSKVYIGKVEDTSKLYYGAFDVKDAVKDSNDTLNYKKITENKKLIWSEK